MKNYSSALALAAALALPMTAAQAAVEFGGDFEVNAYTLDLGDRSDTGDDEQAAQQLLRLRAHFQNEDGVQVNTQISLADTVWEGHSHADVDDGPFSDRHASDVTLDYGYVQIPFNLGVLRVGRQETSWAHGLLVEQERRDRILGITKLGNTTVMAFYDKVDEGESDLDDDTYTANLGATGSYNGWLWGLLGVYYMADDDPETGDGAPSDGLFIFSPWFQGEVGGVELAGAMNISNGLDREDIASNFAGLAALNPAIAEIADTEDETGIAAMLRAGIPVGPVKLEGQVLYAQDGGVVNEGFDTFSSFINNNPVTNRNPLSVMNLGGNFSGDQMLLALRASGNVTDKIRLSASVGMVDIDGGVYSRFDASDRAEFASDAEAALPGLVAADDLTAGLTRAGIPMTVVDESAEFYELNAYYQATPSTTIWATVGQLAAEDILGDDIIGYSLNLRTNF